LRRTHFPRNFSRPAGSSVAELAAA